MNKVREATFPDDLPLVRELFQEYAHGTGLNLCFQGFADELATLPGRYARPRGGVWLADGAGCIALRPIINERAYIKRLYVRPAFRGAGVGRALVEQALLSAADRGYRSVCLDTLSSMTGALNLYRSLGFTEVKAYYNTPVAGVVYLGRELS